jgi:hypothetical protein
MGSSASSTLTTEGSIGARHDESPLVRRATPGPTLYFNATFPAESNPRAVVGLIHGFARARRTSRALGRSAGSPRSPLTFAGTAEPRARGAPACGLVSTTTTCRS